MHANRRAAQADISLDHLHLRWGAGAVSNAIAPGRGSVKTGGRGSLGGKRGSVEAPADGLPRSFTLTDQGLRFEVHCDTSRTQGALTLSQPHRSPRSSPSTGALRHGRAGGVAIRRDRGGEQSEPGAHVVAEGASHDAVRRRPRSSVGGGGDDDDDDDDGESDVEGGGDVEAGLQSASSTVSAEGSETGLPPRKNSRIKRARKAAAEKARRTAEEQSGSRPSSRAGTPVDGGPSSPFSRVVHKGEEAAAAEAAEAAAAEAEAAAEAAADAYALAASGGMGGAAETPAIPSLDALVESQEAGPRSSPPSNTRRTAHSPSSRPTDAPLLPPLSQASSTWCNCASTRSRSRRRPAPRSPGGGRWARGRPSGSDRR